MRPLHKILAIVALALGLAPGGRVLADEGMWVFDKLPLDRLKAGLRVRAAARLGRAPLGLGGPVQQRRLGLVRLGRRPGDDQPPRRGRHAPEDQHQGEGLLQGRLPREDPRRGGQGARPRAERPGRHRGRDREGQRRREGRHGRRGGERRPAGRDGPDRAGVDREVEDAERRRHPLPGRPVRALHLQEVHRRPPRLRPRVRHRLLRRRPGQLRVPPLRPRRLLLPGLRGRQAGPPEGLPQVERRRLEGRGFDLRRRPPGADQPAQHGRAPGIPPRPQRSRS